MFSIEQRKKAIELYIKYDHSYAAVIRELGYPERHMLRNWWKEYESAGDIGEDGRRRRKGKYSDERKRAAVNHYLEHGKCAARTVGKLGYPSKQALAAGSTRLLRGSGPFAP